MVENRNEKCNNNFIWNQFLAELDVKTIKSGEAYNIQSWPTLQMFSGEVYYRLHLPVSGKFRVVYPGGNCLVEPGNYKEGKGLIRREQAGHAQYTPGKCLLKNGKLHCADPVF